MQNKQRNKMTETKKFKKVRTKRDIEIDPRVVSLDYEGSDGWWCYLEDGYESYLETNFIHEETIEDVCHVLNYDVWHVD